MTIKFNTKTPNGNGQFEKELKISATIEGADGNPKEVNLGYLALFSNNDILTTIADMDDEEVKNLASKLILQVQDAGIRMPKTEKRKIKFL